MLKQIHGRAGYSLIDDRTQKEIVQADPLTVPEAELYLYQPVGTDGWIMSFTDEPLKSCPKNVGCESFVGYSVEPKIFMPIGVDLGVEMKIVTWNINGVKARRPYLTVLTSPTRCFVCIKITNR